jgi:hypothetical protein
MIRFAALTGAIECICSVVIFGLPFYSNGVCWDAEVDGANMSWICFLSLPTAIYYGYRQPVQLAVPAPAVLDD